MTYKRILLIGAIVIGVGLLSACAGAQGVPGSEGPAGPPGAQGPAGAPGRDAVVRNEYVGSERCSDCHADAYAKFALSGHAHALTTIENGERPRFPYDEITRGILNPPDGTAWDDIAYVIGGYARKTLFVDNEGYVLTGADENAATQFVFENEDLRVDAGFVSYHAGEQVAFDCAACHATGYQPEGHQDDRAGVVGTWELPAVQCEACHGRGGLHVSDPYRVPMPIDRSAQLCGACHTSGHPAQIEAVAGFAAEYQQFDELFNSKHFALDCVTCHDPHASATFADAEVNPDLGMLQSCDTCHWQNVTRAVDRHLGVSCSDCHMPPMMQSAAGDAELFLADVRSHQFSINVDPDAAQFRQVGDVQFVQPYLTVPYVCGACHNGRIASEQDLATLYEVAARYHQAPVAIPEE